MLQLDEHIKLTPAAIRAANLCDRFSPDDLARIGIACSDGYNRDEMSRLRWLQRNEAGMDLALQLQKIKSFPWAGCSNVAFPLITIAALQFHARAYPALLNGPDVVRMQVIGPDPDGSKSERAEKVSADMSWQVLTQDVDWESQHDKMLLNLSIVGTTFKKSYYDAALKRNVSSFVPAKNLVLDYWATSVENCPRKSEIIYMSRNEIRAGVLNGIYQDVLEEAWFRNEPVPSVSEAQAKENARQGVTPPSPDETTMFKVLEQHVVLDLDGDGFAEPYIITFEEKSKAVLRIVTRFREEDLMKALGGKYAGQIISIKAEEFYTKYSFIPSPDCGIYDIGFGVFLGPLNESVNSLINQLIDAGTMQTTAGGFLGRGAKIRGGAYTFAPFQWNRVDSSGDDLRKNILPLPVNEPSTVLFQLLSLLINYTNRISGSTDMMVGENPGQNTPAETSRTMVEMGQKIYTAIFKRVWHGTKLEFQKLYKLNRVYGELMGALGPAGSTRDDYLGPEDGVVPAADPNVTSDVLAVQLATSVKQAAMTNPGYDKDVVERNWLKAMKVSNIDKVYPGLKGQELPKDPKIVVAEMKLQQEQMQLQAEREQFIIKLMSEERLNNAKIAQLIADAQKLMADSQSEQSYAKVAEINAAISAAKLQGEEIHRRIEHMLDAAKLRLEEKKIAKEPSGDN